MSFPGNIEGRPGPVWTPDTLDSGKQPPSFDNVLYVNFPGKATVQFNLAVGFALREEWGKASNIVAQLYRDGQNASVQVCRRQQRYRCQYSAYSK